MVFKAENPSSRLSKATPKWCRSTLSVKTQRQFPFQLLGSEADKGCMRELPPLATTRCDKVLCTVATETSKHHWTLPNEGRWAKRETP